MRCLVCGTELNGATICPVPSCREQVESIIGVIDDELQAELIEEAKEFRQEKLQDVKLYLKIYFWKDVDGDLVEKSSENIQIGQDIGALEIDQVKWTNTEFAKQIAGESLDLAVVVERESNSVQEQKVSVMAPNTEGLWKIGCVLKPGFKAAVRVGDERVYCDSNEIDLRG